MSQRQVFPRLALACALAGLICTPAPASAQGPPSPPGESSGLEPFTGKAISQLRLNPQQQAAFAVFQASIADASGPPAAGPDVFRAMNFPQKFDYMADRAEIFAKMMRERADVAHRLYDVLSPDQRSGLEAMMEAPQGSLAPSTKGLPAPSAPSGLAPPHTNPDWLIRPSEKDIDRIYPRAARGQHIVGVARVKCIVDTDGYLSDCTVYDETPGGVGFGNAALEATGYMRMKPATDLGVPVESEVIVPVEFHL